MSKNGIVLLIPAGPLTKRELDIALYAAQGLSNKEITDKVFLSESRVKTSLSGIYRKLGITGKDKKRALLARALQEE